MQPIITPDAPASDSIQFPCPYCGGMNKVPPSLASCVVPCPHCARDVLTPVDDLLEQPPAPPKFPARLRSILAVVIFGIVGAIIGGALLGVPAWMYALTVIGIGARHVTLAASVGILMGGFLGGLAGYWFAANETRAPFGTRAIAGRRRR